MPSEMDRAAKLARTWWQTSMRWPTEGMLPNGRVSFHYLVEHGMRPFLAPELVDDLLLDVDGWVLPETAHLDFVEKVAIGMVFSTFALRTEGLVRRFTWTPPLPPEEDGFLAALRKASKGADPVTRRYAFQAALDFDRWLRRRPLRPRQRVIDEGDGNAWSWRPHLALSHAGELVRAARRDPRKPWTYAQQDAALAARNVRLAARTHAP